MNTITPQLREQFGLHDSIEDIYNFIKSNPSDQKGKNSIQWIAHYMETLYKYASQCDSVIEIGVNQVNSTWAFLHAKPKDGVVCIDIDLHKRPWQSINVEQVQYNRNIWLDWARHLASEAEIPFEAVETDSLKYQVHDSDLLFIDGLHTYDQVSKELRLYSPHIKKYIIVHDTVLYSEVRKAVTEFVQQNSKWRVLEKLTSNPGLTVLHYE